MIMSLVQKGSGCIQGGYAVGFQVLVLKIDLPFIVNSVRGTAVMTRRVSGSESTGSARANTPVIVL